MVQPLARTWARTALNPFMAGTEAWRTWWIQRGISERVRARDGPVLCATCFSPAIVLNCLHGQDALQHPQVERWCRCHRCGRPWRDLTTLVDRSGRSLADIESPLRLVAIERCVADASRRQTYDDPARPDRGDPP